MLELALKDTARRTRPLVLRQCCGHRLRTPAPFARRRSPLADSGELYFLDKSANRHRERLTAAHHVVNGARGARLIAVVYRPSPPARLEPSAGDNNHSTPGNGEEPSEYRRKGFKPMRRTVRDVQRMAGSLEL
jgi:hypothetical protein